MKEMCMKCNSWTLKSYFNTFSLFFMMANPGSIRKGLSGSYSDLPQGLCTMPATCLGSCPRSVPCMWSLEWIIAIVPSIADFKALLTVLHKSKEAKQTLHRKPGILQKIPLLTSFYSRRNKTIE